MLRTFEIWLRFSVPPRDPWIWKRLYGDQLHLGVRKEIFQAYLLWTEVQQITLALLQQSKVFKISTANQMGRFLEKFSKPYLSRPITRRRSQFCLKSSLRSTL